MKMECSNCGHESPTSTVSSETEMMENGEPVWCPACGEDVSFVHIVHEEDSSLTPEQRQHASELRPKILKWIAEATDDQIEDFVKFLSDSEDFPDFP